MYFKNKIGRLLPFLCVASADAVCRLARDWSKKTLFPLGNFPQMKRQGGPATPAGEVAREHFSVSF